MEEQDILPKAELEARISYLQAEGLRLSNLLEQVNLNIQRLDAERRQLATEDDSGLSLPPH